MNDSEIDPDRVLAEKLIGEEKFDQAIALYLKLAERHPGEDSYLLALAWAYHDSGDLAKAVDYFRMLLEKELKLKVFTGFAFDELVRIYKELSEFDALIDICERAVAVQPGDIALLNELGSAYMKGARYGQAAETYEKMTVMEPDDAVFFCHWGDALIAMDEVAKAERAYGSALEIDPSGAASFLFRMANRLTDSGHDDAAERSLKQCIAHRSDEPLYQCALGDCLIRQARLQDAVAAYSQASLLDPSSAGAYFNRLGNSLAKAGYYREAIEAFKQAAAKDPDNILYLLHWAESCRQAGFLEEASRILQEHHLLP